MTFVRYIAIQLIAYAIDMGGFMLLLYTGLFNPLYANACGKIAAGIFAFLAHQRFTFQVGKNQRSGGQAVRYMVLLGLNVPISMALLAALLIFIDMPVVAKFLSDVACVALSFFASRQWVFRSQTTQPSP